MIDAVRYLNVMEVLFRRGAYATSVHRDPTCWASSSRQMPKSGGPAVAPRLRGHCHLCRSWIDTGQDVQLYEWHPAAVCRRCFDEVRQAFWGAFLPVMTAAVRLELPPYWLPRVFKGWLYGEYLWERRDRGAKTPCTVPALDAGMRYREEVFRYPDFEARCEIKVKDESPPSATTRGPVPSGRPVQWRKAGVWARYAAAAARAARAASMPPERAG